MHSLLENYLAEVAAQLAPLPTSRRSDELREMRQHLMNAVTVNREIGQTEDEAAQSALEQFGTPKALAEHLVWAWQREQKSRRYSFLGAATGTLTFLSLLFYALTPVLAHYYWMFYLYGDSADNLTRDLLFFFVFGVSGLFAGFLFPKRAMAGTSTSVTAVIVGAATIYPEDFVDYVWADVAAMMMLLFDILGACAGSRWRTSRLRRQVAG